LERAHNLGVMARMLLNGESRFFSVCDVNGLDVAKRSPGTTSTLEAGQRLSSHRGLTRGTESRKAPALSSLDVRDRMLIAIIADPTAPVFSTHARRPPTRMPRGLPLLQQLQCRDSGFVQSQTARKPACIPGFLAKLITCSGQIIAIDQSLPNSSRTTNSRVAHDSSPR